LHIDIETLLKICHEAGAAIMEIYSGEIQVETKQDQSPLTEADRAAHDIIVRRLEEHFTGIPVLSEEGADIDFETRRSWQEFWLVDPLDGTKEFINRNGEFTVNIALVAGHRVRFGMVHVPAQQKTYWGEVGAGAWLQEKGAPPRRIMVRPQAPGQGLTVVVSRSHPSPELDAYLQTLNVAETIAVGSSLKLCTLAEGRADLYPRFGPTMEWDIAAGQAVVEAAGGWVRTFAGSPLRYNKQNLKNPYFLAAAASP